MPVIMTFYEPGTPLTELLLTHSRLVAEKALDCMERHPELDLDAV